MKQFFVMSCVVLLLLGMVACTSSSVEVEENKTSDKVENKEELMQESSDDVIASEDMDNSDEQTVGASEGEIIKQCELEDYPTSEDSPTLEQLSKYLEKTIAFHNAKVIGDPELWEYTRTTENDYTWTTLLFTYPVLEQGSDEIVNWGVDNTNGYVTSWNPKKDFTPEYVDTPPVFDTPEKALKYVKDHLAYTDSNLELIPGESGSEMTNNQYPAYRSKEFLEEGFHNSSNIDIDSVSENYYYIHAYSFQVDYLDDGEGHTATIGWYYVYKNGFISNGITFESFIADEAL